MLENIFDTCPTDGMNVGNTIGAVGIEEQFLFLEKLGIVCIDPG
jgi:hypothetical protein